MPDYDLTKREERCPYLHALAKLVAIMPYYPERLERLLDLVAPLVRSWATEDDTNYDALLTIIRFDLKRVLDGGSDV